MTDHENFMRVALSEAELAVSEGNMGTGAVIVEDGRVISRGRNQSTTLADVTAHAETQAVRRLSLDRRVVNPSLRADSGPLRGTTLYTTVEPCPMCAWAICIAGISELVIGARFARMGIGYGGYAIERLLELTGQPLRVVSGVLHDACAAVRLTARG
jgi:tRNA(adenine34) deaminase